MIDIQQEDTDLLSPLTPDNNTRYYLAQDVLTYNTDLLESARPVSLNIGRLTTIVRYVLIWVNLIMVNVQVLSQLLLLLLS